MKCAAFAMRMPPGFITTRRRFFETSRNRKSGAAAHMFPLLTTALRRTRRCSRPGGLQRLVRRNAVVNKGNICAAAPLFLFLDVSKNRLRVVMKPGGMRIANAAHFINNRIGFVHGFTFLSSSGVQMIGAL